MSSTSPLALSTAATAWQRFAERRPRIGSLVQTLAIGFQLGLLVILIREFSIETRAFLNLSILTLFGFLVHASLPRPWRLPFFAALSLAGIWLVLGVESGSWVIGLGLLLIALCHAPVPFAARGALVLAAGAAMVALREEWLPSAIPQAIWPVLGSMFMFRVIVYLYDLKHAEEKPTAPWTLSYFFLLPNVCFPLFPVVDFTRFRSSYYARDDHRIYQRGVKWMFRGLYQLLGYRFVYYHLSLDPAQVSGAVELAQYTLAAFLLYLRVSGYFHLIVGMLLLFGFDLPETHHRYYLASSFNDFWRRINIYWKDFMMKIFYYPAFFRLRKLGGTKALVLATGIVFLMTWALHVYQWYWILGGVLFAWHDALFWAVLGVAVVANSLWEQKRGRRRRLVERSRSRWARASVALRTAATFVVIAALWGMWTADSLAQWIALWSRSGLAWLWTLILVAFLYAAAALCARRAEAAAMEQASPGAPAGRDRAVSFWRPATATTAAILFLLGVGHPLVYGRLGAEAAETVSSLKDSRLNERDTNLLERGYYEQLVALNQHNAQLWELYNKEPLDWKRLNETEAWRPLDDMLMGELVPSTELVFKRQPVKINRWGFRDREYALEKPPGTYRIAILGASHVFGSGVRNGENFESVVEERLNEAAPERAPGEASRTAHAAFEILNFAVPNRSALEDLEVLRRKVAPFGPDAVIHFAHTHDLHRLARHVPKIVHAAGGDIPYPWLAERFAELGIDERTASGVIELAVQPHAEEILSWAYRAMAEWCRERGITPIYAVLPRTWERSEDVEDDTRQLLAMAERAGFVTLDVTAAYDGHTTEELRIASWDFHPNPLGHRLLAERVLAELDRTDALPARPARPEVETADDLPAATSTDTAS